MITAPFSQQAPSLPNKPYEKSIEFTGTASEYFRIWVVNIFLSIVTLGIYSAWATVRTRKYFYQHTRLLGHGFDFHGDPKRILKGRLIAVAAYLAFMLLSRSWPVAGMVLTLVLYLVLPALIVQALRFRMANTSYRGLRFGFAGKLREAYVVYLLLPIASVLSLGLAMPYLTCRSYRYWLAGTRFGAQAFTTDLSVKTFYRIYLQLLGLLVLVIAAMSVPAYLLDEEGKQRYLSFLGPLLPAIVLLSFWFLIRPFMRAKFLNHMYGRTHVGRISFRCSVGFGGLFWMSLTNFLMIALSFGLLVPCAKVRSARYMAGRLEVCTPDLEDMDEFIAGLAVNPAATGDQLADLFNIDVPALG